MPHAQLVNNDHNAFSSSENASTKRTTIRQLIGSLPVELRHKILNNERNEAHSKCYCSSICCKLTTHTNNCQSRDRIIDPKINLLFPISSRIRENRYGQKFTELYMVLTMLPQNAQRLDEFHYGDFRSAVSADITKARVLNRVHFQGNILEMNSAVFNDLRILKTDVSFMNSKSNGLFREVRNDFYKPKSLFHDIQIECSHEKEFIPKLSNAKPHYLLFD